ncbi:MAG: tRNA (adenosine(37)-N6)-threonylcarbamoyltransferase complex dimerization subunit type 1 TsaB [Chiayiivirga sp.]|jgi:tRNA threonylcarbamoyladenosine biosynthesis protein TsaB|nr:tRNA (adenosine(37)-N6)-threonylcarbamoyltransferase complex dimerization subunit type 1 TsaB [Chiayiivirga sp.]
MRLLAFETATEACSVAVYVDGEICERFDLAPRRHAELALPWAGTMLAEAGIARSQLDAIAVGRGPGAFTGVRLAIAIAQGIALALGSPGAWPVSTLAALAFAANAGAGRRPCILPPSTRAWARCIWAAFEREPEDVRLLGSEHLLRPVAASPDPSRRWIGVGTGFDAEQGALRTALGSTVARVDAAALPHAAAVARLAVQAYARGEIVAPERLEPAYLRDKVALTLAEQGKPRPS